MEINPCDQQGDIMIDAMARDLNGQLLFLSVYGRDGSVQQFMSRLQLSQHQDGIQKLSVQSPNRRGEFQAVVGDPRRFKKATTKLPKACLFGPLVNAWFFDPALIEPDRVNGKGWLMFDLGQTEQKRELALWAMVKFLSPLPLLDEWREPLMATLKSMVFNLDEGHACIAASPGVGPLDFVFVQLPTNFEELVSSSIRSGLLQIPPIAA